MNLKHSILLLLIEKLHSTFPKTSPTTKTIISNFIELSLDNFLLNAEIFAKPQTVDDLKMFLEKFFEFFFFGFVDKKNFNKEKKFIIVNVDECSVNKNILSINLEVDYKYSKKEYVNYIFKLIVEKLLKVLNMKI